VDGFWPMLVVFFAKRYDIEVARFARAKPVAKDMMRIRWWVLVTNDARQLLDTVHMLHASFCAALWLWLF